MRVRAWSGAQYTGIVLDDCSNYKNGVTVKLKSDFKKEYRRIKRKLGVSLKYLRTDGSGENVGADFEDELWADGTQHERSAQHWQNQNGQCENA
eukprot:1859732-Rhodomonas_salina.1